MHRQAIGRGTEGGVMPGKIDAALGEVARPDTGGCDMMRNSASEVAGAAAEIDHARLAHFPKRRNRSVCKELCFCTRDERPRCNHELDARKSRASSAVRLRD